MWIWRLVHDHKFVFIGENGKFEETVFLNESNCFDNGTSKLYHEYSDYITNWADTIILFYFIYSTILLVLSYQKQIDKDISISSLVPWYYYPVQFLYQTALSYPLGVTAQYWMVYWSLPDEITFLTIHTHGIIS